MRLLLDSHVMLWLIYNPDLASSRVVKLLAESDENLVSQATYWELAIKFINKKLNHGPQEINKLANLAGFQTLEIKQKHIEHLPKISLTQKDPFDHLLLTQTISEDLILLTSDKFLLNSTYPTLSFR